MANAMETQELVPASEIERHGTPEEATTGLSLENLGEPRPDLAGRRLIPLSEASPIYLVNPEGYLQHVPSTDTYVNLFNDWDGIIRTDIAGIAIGAPLTDGAVLTIGSGTPQLYIVSNGVKRHITSEQVMGKYNFSRKYVQNVAHVLVDSIPTGTDWS
jgi:hypothetical protein